MENQFNNEYIRSLIAKKLAGEATPAEMQEIEDWKNTSAENAAYLAQFENLWNYSTEPDIFSDKTDAAWNKVYSGMHKKQLPGIHISYRAAFSVAASIALLLGVWFFWPQKETIDIAKKNVKPS